jgi:WD40 repeat protein
VLATVLAFSPDGRMLAARSGHLGPDKPEALVLFAFPKAVAAGPALPPVAAAPEPPPAVELNLRPLEGHTMRIGGLRILADSKRAISVSWDGTLRIWDLKEGKTLKLIKAGEPLARLASGGTGNTVAVATGVPFDAKGMREAKSASLVLIHLASGKITRPIKDLPLFADPLAFSADSSRVAAMGLDMLMWDVASGRPVRRPALTPLGEPPHSGRVEQILFAPGGKRLISGGADGLIKFWDPVRLRPVQTLTGHGKAVTALAVARDGKQLVSGSKDHTVIL